MHRTRDRQAFPDPLRITLLEGDADTNVVEHEEIRQSMKELTVAVDARLGKIQASLIAILMVLVAALIGFSLNLIQ